MRREFYNIKPKEAECFAHGGGTDVIMRQNIRQVEQHSGSPEGSEEAPQTVWECEEWQFRQSGILTPDEVKADWKRYWGYTPIPVHQKTGLAAELEAVRADVDYVAMMAGVDLPIREVHYEH